MSSSTTTTTGKRKSSSSKIAANMPLKKKAKVYKQNYGLRGAAKTVQKYEAHLPEECFPLIYQTLDPEENSKQIVRWPNIIGGSSVLASKTVFQAEVATDGKTSVMVHPYMTNAITATTAALQELPITGLNSATSPKPYVQQEIKTTNAEDWYFTNPMQFSPGVISYPVNRGETATNSQSTEVIYWFLMHFDAETSDQISLAPEAAALVNLQYALVSATDYRGGECRVTTYNRAGAEIQEITDITLVGGNNVPFLTCGDVVNNEYKTILDWNPNNANDIIIGISVALTNPRGIFGIGSFFLAGVTDNANLPNLNAGECNWVCTLTHNTHKMRDLTDADVLFQQAGQYAVIAQSLLMTCTNSSENNQGNIASCRMPGGKRLGGGSTNLAPDWYGYISSLAYNAYEGPVRNGTYTWYLGKDQNSYDYTTVDGIPFEKQDENYMAGIATGNLDLSMRIKVFTLIVFTSSNSLYEQQVSPYIPELPLILQMLGLCNSSFENGTHARQLKDQLKKYSAVVLNQTKRILKDPNTYKTAAKYIVKYGPTAINAAKSAAAMFA